MRPGGIRFLLAFVLTVAAVLGSLAAFLAVLDSTGRLRAPIIANNWEFDEKLRYLRKNGLAQVDVLLIGSSTTLNGVDGRTLQRHLGEDAAILNMGVSGLNVGQVRYMAEFMQGHVPTIDTVIMVSTRNDFDRCPESDKAFFDSAHAADYLFGRSSEIAAHLKFLNLDGVIAAIPHIAERRRSPDIPGSAYFDEWGSQLQDPPAGAISIEEWVGDYLDMDDRCYGALEDLVTFYRREGVRFVFAMAPMRAGHVAHHDPDGEKLEAHVARAARIVEAAGGTFVDAHSELKLPESDFYDALHIRRDVAPKLTRLLVSALQEHADGQREVSAGPPATAYD